MNDAPRLNRARVCLVTPEFPPSFGGVGVTCARVAAALANEGALVTVVTRDAIPGASGEVRDDRQGNVKVYRFIHEAPLSTPAAFAFRQLLRSLDERHRFDIFQGFFLNETFPCLQLDNAGGNQRPVIASIHGDDALTRIAHPLWRGQILSVLKRATWVTSVSEEYLQRVSAEVDVSRRGSVIRNAAVALAPDGASWTLTDEVRGRVGTVGELRRVKDMPLLVRGYAGVRRETRRGLILGGYFADPDEERWTAALVDELGLAGETHLTGPLSRDAVGDCLHGLHVYVQSSAYEALPNALLEAAALGVPLVATAVGGMREVLTDGRNALLVPHGAPRALSAAIQAVIDDEALARRLSEEGKRLAANLSPGREAVEWTALYARLLRDERG